MDFIAKYVWVFIIIGVIIIIIAIGYLVDKLVVNKDNQGKVNQPQSNLNNQAIIPNLNNQINNELMQNNYETRMDEVNMNSQLTDSNIVSDTSFDTESVKEESVNVDIEKNTDSVWKV